MPRSTVGVRGSYFLSLIRHQQHFTVIVFVVEVISILESDRRKVKGGAVDYLHFSQTLWVQSPKTLPDKALTPVNMEDKKQHTVETLILSSFGQIMVMALIKIILWEIRVEVISILESDRRKVKGGGQSRIHAFTHSRIHSLRPDCVSEISDVRSLRP